MKTLESYINNAYHYLFPDESIGGTERQRNFFKNYCLKHGLLEEFQEAVRSNPEWESLAETEQIYFFEEPRRNKRSSNDRNITVFCAESGTVPVIKLFIPSIEAYRSW